MHTYACVIYIGVGERELFIKITEGQDNNKHKWNGKYMLTFLGFVFAVWYSMYSWNEYFSMKWGPSRLPIFGSGLDWLVRVILWIFCWLNVQWLNIWPYWGQLPHRNWQMLQITALLFQERFLVSIYQITTACMCVYRCMDMCIVNLYNIYTQSIYKGIEN